MPAHISRVVYTRFAGYLGILVVLVLLAACAQTRLPATPPAVTLIPVTVEVTRLVPVAQTQIITVERTRVVNINATRTPYVTPDPGKLEEENSWFTGTYGDIKPEVSGCTVKVIHTRYEWLSQIDFELECSRGAPSYNMGYKRGSVQMDYETAVFSAYDDTLGDTCYLVFNFGKDQVEISQDGYCGFGGGVYADGLYPRVSRSVPVFCGQKDGPCK